MQPIVKQQLDKLIMNCSDDEERKILLMETGTQTIMQAYMRIVDTVTSDNLDVIKLTMIKEYVVSCSEMIAYINDQIIFYGYGDLTAYDVHDGG